MTDDTDGMLTTRVPAGQLAALKAAAAERGKSLSDVIRQVLTTWLEQSTPPASTPMEPVAPAEPVEAPPALEPPAPPPAPVPGFLSEAEEHAARVLEAARQRLNLSCSGPPLRKMQDAQDPGIAEKAGPALAMALSQTRGVPGSLGLVADFAASDAEVAHDPECSGRAAEAPVEG